MRWCLWAAQKRKISGKTSISGCFFKVRMQLVLYLKLHFFPCGCVFYLGGFLCHDGSKSQPWPLFFLAIPCASQIPREQGSILYMPARRPKLQQTNPLQGAGFSLPSCLLHPQAPASATGRRLGDSHPLHDPCNHRGHEPKHTQPWNQRSLKPVIKAAALAINLVFKEVHRLFKMQRE